MSTYYRPRTPLKLDDVRDFKEFDVVKDGKDWGFQSKNSFLSVEKNSRGFVIDVYPHGSNNVDDIFPHIKKELGVSFISEGDINYIDYRDEESKVYMLRFEVVQLVSEPSLKMIVVSYPFNIERTLMKPTFSTQMIKINKMRLGWMKPL